MAKLLTLVRGLEQCLQGRNSFYKTRFDIVTKDWSCLIVKEYGSENQRCH